MWGNVNDHAVLVSIKIGTLEGNLAQYNQIKDTL